MKIKIPYFYVYQPDNRELTRSRRVDTRSEVKLLKLVCCLIIKSTSLITAKHFRSLLKHINALHNLRLLSKRLISRNVTVTIKELKEF